MTEISVTKHRAGLAMGPGRDPAGQGRRRLLRLRDGLPHGRLRDVLRRGRLPIGCQRCLCCGCKLVPVCNITCVPKTTTEHKYCCKCKEICIPGVSHPGEGCEHCGECGACDGGCNACDPCKQGCQDGGNCHCRVREIHKLMVCPVTKETHVKQCTVQWVCPDRNR